MTMLQNVRWNAYSSSFQPEGRDPREQFLEGLRVDILCKHL